MGALYGYFHLHNIDTGVIHEQMCAPALYWGKDDRFIYHDKQIELGYLHRYNTPESVFESQPHKTQNGNIIFFNGRIDNRLDLLIGFGLQENSEFPDGKLVEICWEKYKTDLVHHLEGDWVIVVWESDKLKLHILRDHHGYSALYYYCNDKLFAFATCIKSLLALDQIPKKPNLKRVAQILTSWQGDGLNSAYDGIFRLPPAHVMEVNEKLIINVKRYWFPENIQPLHLENEEDYYRQFFEEYSRAVNVKLRSYKPVGSQLSGGLDSGTVVALAAMQLKKSGIRLPAFTSVPAFDIKGLTSKTRFGDEGRLAKLTADFTGNTDWIPVDANDVDPFFEILKGVDIHDEPLHSGSNLFWIQEIEKLAQKMDLGTMLTGQGGNAIVSWPTSGYMQIMSKKSDLIKFRHFSSYIGWRQVILPLFVPVSIKRIIKRSKAGPFPYLAYSAISNEFAIKQKILDQMQEDGHDPYFIKSTSANKDRFKIIKPGRNIGGFLHSQSAAWHNLEARDPTIDKRLIEFCLSVPHNIYVSEGKDRMLLRRAFDGMMPEEVLWNTNRGRQAADIGHRVLKYRETGKKMLDNLSASPLCREILDIERMKIILDSLEKEINSSNTSQAGTVLLRGITVGLFLLRFENGKVQP